MLLCAVLISPPKNENKMKKIVMAAAIIFASLGFATAQKAPTKTTDKTKIVEKKTAATDKKIVEKTKATNLKKDGTPDMRLKENKDKVKTTTKVVTKKDGTPDMRYKANKKK